MEGESLRKICRDEGFPDRRTVIRWMDANEDFAAKCARAREEQADFMADRVLEVAADVASGDLDPNAGRVVISALQWTAAKLRPKRYGDKVTNELTGKDGQDLIPKEVSNIELARRVAYILTREVARQENETAH